MFLLWVSAALVSVGAAALILLRGARAAVASPGGDPRVAIHRRALAEIDALAGRGLLGDEEHRLARAEAGRRLLTAAEREPEPAVMTWAPSWAVLAAAATAPLAAAAIYGFVGTPGMADQPFAQRLAAWRAHPERYQAPELAADLGAAAVEHPDDPEPLRRLAELDLSMGDADGAIHALRRADRIAPDRADILAPLGEVMVLKSHGKTDAETRATFERLLRLDPASPAARYFLGRARIEEGEAAAGLAQWRGLLADLDAADPRRAALSADIASVETTGALPPDAPAPAAPDVSAAIHGMVEGLAARLAAHPDDPPGWVRLVRAFAVLGDDARERAALAQARRLYATRPEVLRALDAAARSPVVNDGPKA